jgi:hypothetical protein
MRSLGEHNYASYAPTREANLIRAPFALLIS